MIITSKASHISINSLMGRLEFDRTWFHCRLCGEGYAPFDRELEIDGEHKLTKGLIDTLCDFAQRMSSFEEASYVMEKYLGIKVSASMIQMVSEEVGKRLFEKEKQEAKDLYQNQYKAISSVPDSKKKSRIYIEADGSMLLIRHEGYKEIKLGMIFKDSQIINKDKERHIICEKDYVACLGTAEEFKKMLWAAAIRNGYQDVKEVVILGDGSKWIWNIATELFPDAVFILDYYHFKEHVHGCAKVVYPENEISRKRWVDDIIGGFMEDKIEEALEYLKPEDFSEELVCSKVRELKTYLENNKEKMRYKEYREKGYFIGSGAVESAHKHVIQQRLKLAGMRWSRDGAQYIAALRAASKSNRWNKVAEIIYNKVS